MSEGRGIRGPAVFFALGLCLVLSLAQAGCVFIPVVPYDRQTSPVYSDGNAKFHSLSAYDREWQWFNLEEARSRPVIDRTFGHSGGDPYYRTNSEWLRNDRGEEKRLDQMLDALQADGSLAPYIPQHLIHGYSHIRDLKLFETGDRLFVMVVDDANYVTNLPASPPNRDPGYRRDPKVGGDQSIFFGELDPQGFRFKITEFVPGFDRSELERLSKDRGFNQRDYLFQHREPLSTLLPAVNRVSR